ncbi:hypothetical protein ABZW30_39600 [Kitasatospora sp. NPDC004669]|uniref:hypothetical protein n=1 Tax=Kitasatospora sp. NPDC004669 TaxID=3154555 RepID=UPI0033AF29B2
MQHQNTIYEATAPVALCVAAVLARRAEHHRGAADRVCALLLGWLAGIAYDSDDACVAAHQELMDSLACTDCGDIPEQESTWEYGLGGQWTRRSGGRCWTCHQQHTQRLEREAQEQLEAARTANALLRPCWPDLRRAVSRPGCGELARPGRPSAGEFWAPTGEFRVSVQVSGR